MDGNGWASLENLVGAWCSVPGPGLGEDARAPSLAFLPLS